MNTRRPKRITTQLTFRGTFTCLCIFFLLVYPPLLFASDDLDLTNLSLEDLMSIEVSLVSRRQEKLFHTPAAVYVLTKEDIRRSGVTSIPEALRLVPGMVVGRVDANKWAVSARGHNGRFAQELLVLVDGRTIYTPLFSGVFWEMRDVMLEDVSHIEVIRGPGGTLWGANAVNGIINIVTDKAAKGGVIKGGTGTEEKGFGSVRYGFQLDANTAMRVYGKFFSRDAFVDATNQKGADAWHMSRFGFRLDHHPAPSTTLTLQGDLFTGKRGQVYRFPTLTAPYVQPVESKSNMSGGNLVGRFTKSFSNGQEVSLQSYYDYTTWQDTLLSEKRHIYDIDFQHRLKWASQNELVYGFSFRGSQDDIKGGTWTSVNEPQRSLALYSGFVQNTLTLKPETLNFTVGAKVEHNDHTGFEYQPSVRLLFTPHPQHASWASATRAVRTPARFEDDLRSAWYTLPPDSLFQGSPPVLIYLEGNRDLKSNIVHAYELGHRIRPSSRFFIDAAVYYNKYKDMRAGQVGAGTVRTSPVFHIELPAFAANTVWGETYGLELTTDYQPTSLPLRLRAAYTYTKMALKANAEEDPDSLPGSNDLLASENEANPKHQAFVWASLNPHPNWQIDNMWRFVSALPTLNTKRYLEADLRISWQPTDHFSLAITGQNLLHDHHREYETTLVNTIPTETQRSVYTAFTWSF